MEHLNKDLTRDLNDYLIADQKRASTIEDSIKKLKMISDDLKKIKIKNEQIEKKSKQ